MAGAKGGAQAPEKRARSEDGAKTDGARKWPKIDGPHFHIESLAESDVEAQSQALARGNSEWTHTKAQYATDIEAMKVGNVLAMWAGDAATKRAGEWTLMPHWSGRNVLALHEDGEKIPQTLVRPMACLGCDSADQD